MSIVIDTDRPAVRPAVADDLKNDAVEPGSYFALADERNMRSFGVWHFDGQQITLIGKKDMHSRSATTVPPGATVAETVRTLPQVLDSYFTIQRISLPPGHFYPGMARPETTLYGSPAQQAPDYQYRRDELVASLLQLRSLFGRLEGVFGTVHPARQNLHVFGSAIRDLIILACTECEAQWKGVLRLNGYKSRSNLNGLDYSKLATPLKLTEYRVQLRHYPGLDELSPFEGWEATATEGRLSWYQDYNAIKHDRAAAFSQATLKTAMEAVAACWVMIAAQYGRRALREFPDLDDKFRISVAPRWRLAECYCRAEDGFLIDEASYPF